MFYLVFSLRGDVMREAPAVFTLAEELESLVSRYNVSEVLAELARECGRRGDGARRCGRPSVESGWWGSLADGLQNGAGHALRFGL